MCARNSPEGKQGVSAKIQNHGSVLKAMIT